MLLCSFHVLKTGELLKGLYRDGRYYGMDGFFEKENGRVYNSEDISLDVPVRGGKIVAAGLNYKKHAYEMKMDIPSEPVIFMKPPSAFLPHGGQICYPKASKRVDYEAELSVVIGKECRGITVKEAPSVILGYCPFNDVTARDLQKIDGQWTRAKGFDTFAPCGPYIDTSISDPDRLKVQAILNGRVVQDSCTSDMIFSVSALVSFISGIMTLYPGDIIATGTPEGIGPMNPGDVITVKIGNMPVLDNRVAAG